MNPWIDQIRQMLQYSSCTEVKSLITASIGEDHPHLEGLHELVELEADSPTENVHAEVQGLTRSADKDGFKPTQGMASEARKGLDWRDEHNRGGTAVGIARGRDIANRKNLSYDTVKRMHAFFSRHESNKSGKGYSPGEEGYPSNGRIAWALWGGDAGQTWAADIVEREEKKNKKDAGMFDFLKKNKEPSASESKHEYIKKMFKDRVAKTPSSKRKQLYKDFIVEWRLNDKNVDDRFLMEELKKMIVDRATIPRRQRPMDSRDS